MTEQTTHEKLHLHPDTFLYSIHQARAARTQSEGSFRSHLRYEPFLTGVWAAPADLSDDALAKELYLLFKHHAQAIPHYKRNETINSETIAWFAQSFATLFVDLDQMVTGYFGKPLTEVLKENRRFVEDLSAASKKHLKDYADLFNYYVSWCVQSLAPKASEEEPVDWRVRPPCGPLYKAAFKEFEVDRRAERRDGRDNRSERGERRDNRSERGERRDNRSDRGERRNGPREDRRENRGPRPERAEVDVAVGTSTGERPNAPRERRRDDRPDRHSRDRPQRNDRDRPPRQFDDRPKMPSPEEGKEFLERALYETRRAVARLKEDPQLKEVLLKPQNSFIRREQHVIISEAGFATESRGEGKERAVCIIRPN